MAATAKIIPEVAGHYAFAYVKGGAVANGYSTMELNFSDARVSASRVATGRYRVMMPRMNFSTGSVLVTAVGANSRHCKVASHRLVNSSREINVNCFYNSGSAADADFNVIFQPNKRGPYGDGAFYSVGGGSWNSTGAINTLDINNRSNFFLIVRHPGLSNIHSVALVTALGANNANYCKVVRWFGYGTGANTEVQLRCFTPSGANAALNSSFIESYVSFADFWQ